MPVSPQITYPGVYVQEVSSGAHTITAVPTAITVFIGRTLRGPVNEPTHITSYRQFLTLFGGLFIESEMAYAINDFFLNGGQQAIILRLYNPPKPDKKDGLAVSSVLNLVAANPGAWGNQLEVNVDRQDITAKVAQHFNVPDITDLFNLTIKNTSNNGQIERFTNLTIQPIEGRPTLAQVLEQQSSLVRIRTNPNASTTVPAENKIFKFVGGQDSQPLQANHFLGKKEQKTGLFALDSVDIFNLMCIPPDQRGADIDTAVYKAALNYCHDRRAFLIIDPPIAWGMHKETAVDKAIDGFNNSSFAAESPAARNGAIYFPRVIKADPLQNYKTDTFAPSGIIAGIMATTDASRGVWKAPAGTEAMLNGIQGLQVNLDDVDNGRLSPLGINCLRNFQDDGNVVWGARTLRGADQYADDYKYIPVRRLLLMIEKTLYRDTQWAVFEPNDEPLWAQLRLNVGAFMNDLFRQGAFQGQSPKDAYFVHCDSTTTTPSDINKGIVNIMVGFAPLKPADFMALYIQQKAGNTQML